MFSDEYHYRERREPSMTRRTFLTGLGIAAGLYVDKKFFDGAIANGTESVVEKVVDAPVGVVKSFLGKSTDDSDTSKEGDGQEDTTVITQTDKKTTNLIPIVDGSHAKSGNHSVKGLLEISNQTEYYVGQETEIEQMLYDALKYVTKRVGVVPADTFKVDILWDESRHGLTEFSERLVKVWIGPDDFQSFVNPQRIAAHEFIHKISNDAVLTPALEFAIAEGFATWGAGKFWFGSEDIKGYIQNNYGSSLIWPMFGQDVLDRLQAAYHGDFNYVNQIYNQWAGWCDFLISEYGTKKFRSVYTSTAPSLAPGSADYLSVYGKDIDTLALEWRDDWLRA